MLVYVLDHGAVLGRTFSLAVQSIGVVSASIDILIRRREVEWRILRLAFLGAAVVMPLAMPWLAPNGNPSRIEGSKYTEVIEPRIHFLDASVDQTEAG